MYGLQVGINFLCLSACPMGVAHKYGDHGLHIYLTHVFMMKALLATTLTGLHNLSGHGVHVQRHFDI